MKSSTLFAAVATMLTSCHEIKALAAPSPNNKRGRSSIENPTSSSSSPLSSKTKIKTNSSANASTTRRNMMENTFGAAFVLGSSGTVLSYLNPNRDEGQAWALEACRPKARNCIRTTWVAPPYMTREEAVTDLREVLKSYPANGQNGVDCNGWTIVNDSLLNANSNSGTGMARLEYKSCVGPAALAINLAQPFIDDLKIEIEEQKDDDNVARITVQVKSASRMGSSDLFVNRKRLEYLGAALQQKGWKVPDVYKYG